MDQREKIKGRMLVAGAMAATLAFLALAGAAAHGQIWGIDESVRALAHRVQYPALGMGMQAVSTLGDPTGLVPMIVAISGVLWRSRRRYALLVPLVMIGTGLLQAVTKWAVARPRPNLAPWGYPSGHVLGLVVLLGLVCYLIVISGSRRRWHYLSAAGSAIVLIAVAASRLYLEAHWLSDVVGGFAVGLAYLFVVILIVEAYRRTARSEPPASPALEVSPQN
jgi:membrane-associated phospholipid phosphatase